MARTQRSPTLRSVISNWTRWPKSTTEVPNGMAANARKAAIIEIAGARRNVARSAFRGTIGSLKKSLSPSARLVSSPQGPHRLGPIRLCMWAITLRSNQMMNTTSTLSTTKTMMILARMTIRPAREVTASPPRTSSPPAGRAARWRACPAGRRARRRRPGIGSRRCLDGPYPPPAAGGVHRPELPPERPGGGDPVGGDLDGAVDLLEAGGDLVHRQRDVLARGVPQLRRHVGWSGHRRP